MYRTLFQNRNYVKLLSANMINRLGDGIDSIAFTWLTYALTKMPVFLPLCLQPMSFLLFYSSHWPLHLWTGCKTKGYGVV